MKRFNYKYYIRKSHRYLGVFIGIQFIFWTLGGLYFSWTDIDEIHGDFERSKKSEINFQQDFISPKTIVSKIESSPNSPTTIENMRVIEISGSPFYEFTVKSKDKNFVVADAVSGEIREKITG